MALGSPSSSFNYDVFLSFRGEDTRHGFTGHLYNALHSKGIHTFIDDEELQRGEQITPALTKAIQESRVAITVLSQHYASSSFCLDELATILHCDPRKQLLVIPVFYKVDPSDVRHQKGSYGQALAKHETRFQDDPEKLKKWKMALQQVADLSGYHFKDGNEYEYKFIEKIVEQVSRVINLCPLHVADYLVGLKSRVQHVRILLDAGSDDGVHMIGIHGMGGVGKSTLARAVYNDLIIAEKFDGFCFLANVRENSNKHGLEHLQTILLSEIIGEKNINLTSKQKGISIIQSRLTGKKVLLILDDVDTYEQLQAIAGRPDWFGPGSKIIITTRDKQLLASQEVNKTYEVKELNADDALQLLTWKAFKKEKADPNYLKVLRRAVTYASGLPLALEVIGSHLFGKSIEEWESAIKQYKRIPKKEILDILKVSFDALEEEEKSVFLDIACYFKGCNLQEVEHILRRLYDDCMKHHIGVLVEKSLINVSRGGVVKMHDLIQDMGRRIDQESSKEPGKRRRLWLTKDIIQVLEDNSGSSKTEIICLDFSSSEKEATIEWNGNAFKKMRNLKILIIRNGKFSKGPNYFPESLRVLEWHRYPSNCLPSNFHPKELVICKLPHSCIMSFGFHGSRKKFGNLKVLNFERCEFLTEIHDVSALPNLEELSFDSCGNLIRVHDSIGLLNKLKILSAYHCSKLTKFPDLNLTSLERLNLSKCLRLENFPKILGEMKNLRNLELVDLPLKELPVSFQNLVGLERLYLHDHRFGCAHLQEIKGVPPNLKDCRAIECMSLSSSSSSMLLNQELHEAGKTGYCFPGATIPEWFNHQSRGPSSSFWFRNEFPDNVLCLLIARVESESESGDPIPTVLTFINGKLQRHGRNAARQGRYKAKLYYTYLFDLKLACKLDDDLFEVDLEKEWNHVEITYAGILEPSLVKATGIHVFRQDDIRYDDPYGKRKIDHDLNSSESQPHIKKHRISRWVGPERIRNLLWKAADGALITNAERRYRALITNAERRYRALITNAERRYRASITNAERRYRAECIYDALRTNAERRCGALITEAERRFIALKTEAKRIFRHIVWGSSCPRCGVLETCLHALRDCPKVAAFWCNVLPNEQLEPTFFNGDLTVWLETNLCFSAAASFWPTFFGIAVDLLWELGNSVVFYDNVNTWYLKNIKSVVFKRYKDFIRGHDSHNLMTRNLLKWRRPKIHHEWLLRLNVSGAFDPSSGTAACGGIFSDYNDRFVLGYSVKVGECSSKDEAEIWGIYHGMKIARQYDIWGFYRDILRQRRIPISPLIARQHDYGKIHVLSGSQKVIDFVLDGCPTSASASTSTCTSRSLQHCFPLCPELRALTSATNHLYCFCGANKAAKSFAKFGLSMKERAASIFSACPSFCKPYVLEGWY